MIGHQCCRDLFWSKGLAGKAVLLGSFSQVLLEGTTGQEVGAS